MNAHILLVYEHMDSEKKHDFRKTTANKTAFFRFDQHCSFKLEVITVQITSILFL